MTIGERLKILRILHGKSQAELAREANISAAQEGAYEKGDYMPKAEAVFAAAEALMVSPQYLQFGAPYPSGQAWHIRTIRPQILEKITADIRAIFPGLLREMGIDTAVVAEMREGYAILLGRDWESDIILIVADQLAQVILDCIRLREVDITQKTIADIPATESVNHLHRITSETTMKAQKETIIEAWQRSQTTHQAMPLTISPASLADAYEVAVSSRLDPRQFVRLCADVSTCPANRDLIEHLKNCARKITQAE